MPKPTPPTRLVAAILASGALAGGAASAAQAAPTAPAHDARPGADRLATGTATFTHPTRITNPWLPLAVHREAVFLGSGPDGAELRVVRSAHDHTKDFRVDGRVVRAVAVEERAFEDGALRGVSDAYYAQADDGAVYELGRDVRRAAADHRGSSSLVPTHRERGIRLVMPAVPRDGTVIADGRQRVIDTNARVTVAGGAFNRVLVVHTEPTGDEGSQVHYFARGVGLIKARTASGAVELAHLR